MWPDPRPWHAKAARAWIRAQQQPACALCGRPVDITLPGTHPWGPTLEHRIPIRRIRAEAPTWAACIAWAADPTHWAVAHRRCQNQQGARAKNNRAKTQRAQEPRRTTREW